MERRGIVIALCVTAGLSGGVALAQTKGGSPEARKVKNPVASAPASITAGEQLYTKNCAFCHGPKALGDGPLAPKDIKPSNLTDAQWDYGSTDGEIFAVIMNGTTPKTAMVAVKGRLSDTDVWNLVNYIRSIGPKAPKGGTR
ncbi:MAG: cytochrome c [Vicinamibacterales bacterium]